MIGMFSFFFVSSAPGNTNKFTALDKWTFDVSWEKADTSTWTLVSTFQWVGSRQFKEELEKRFASAIDTDREIMEKRGKEFSVTDTLRSQGS